MGFVRVRFRTIVLVACFVAVVQVYLQSWIYRVALTPELDGKQQHEEIITVTRKAKNVISLREQKKAKYTNRPHDLPPKRVIFHIPNKWQDLSPRCTLNDTIEISHEIDSLTHTIICLVPTDESSGIVRLELYNHEKNDIRKTYLHHISSDEIDIAEQEICSLFPAARQADVKKHYFLASFPRSGNTWSRRLLEGATGICTGSVFNDKYLLKMGFSCEGKRKNVLVIKTHLPITPKHHRMVLVNVTGAVIIVRNIFDSIYSYFNYEKSLFLHNVTLDEKLFQGKEWAEYVEKSRNRWLLFYEYWEKYQNPKIYIRYEDLHAHPKLELSRMLGFLERSVDFQRISCTLNGTAVSQTGRTGSSKMGLARRYFTIDMQKKILNKVGPMMRRYGYGPFVDLIAEEISSAEN